MSLAVVKRFADHHWCAAAATLTSATADHMLDTRGANIVGMISNAASSIVSFRARFRFMPVFISAPESQPPPTDPTSATR